MELLSHPIIAVVLLLGILVIVHEAGHFLVGKFFKIPVEVFSIGFGPVLIGFKKGETEYRLSAIPLGGFVKFYGSVPSESVPESIRGREFFRASKRARIATIAAGPIANLVLAVVVFSGMIMYGIKQPPPIIGEILKDSPAQRAGLKFGDTVSSIDGASVKSWKDIQRMIGDSPERNLRLVVERSDGVHDVVLAPEAVKDEDLPGNRGRIGISRVMIPSVVAIVDKTGLFARAGFKTGDRISKIEWGTESRNVRYWQEVLQIFEVISSQQTIGSSDLLLTFSISQSDPSEAQSVESNSKFLPERTLQLTLPRNWAYSEAMFVDYFGATSGEIAVFKLEEPSNGLIRGDVLTEWEGRPVKNAFDFSNLIANHRSPEAEIGFLRDGKVLKSTIKLKAVEVQKAEGKVIQYTLPVTFWGAFEQPEWIEERYTNPLEAMIFAVRETWTITKSIGKAIGGLFTGEMPLATLGGPIAIAKVASDSVRIGWQAFFSALAVISINLALLNLIPIPILDGGQLVLISVEAMIRRPVPEEAIENYQKVGFIMVLALFVVATYNDVGRFWASMVRGLSGMF